MESRHSEVSQTDFERSAKGISEPVARVYSRHSNHRIGLRSSRIRGKGFDSGFHIKHVRIPAAGIGGYSGVCRLILKFDGPAIEIIVFFCCDPLCHLIGLLRARPALQGPIDALLRHNTPAISRSLFPSVLPRHTTNTPGRIVADISNVRERTRATTNSRTRNVCTFL